MDKIIVAGHICLDITPVFSRNRNYSDLSDLFIPGKLINVEDASVHSGGCVSNTGLALKLLGNNVSLLGKTGCDKFGEILKSIVGSYGAGGLIEDKDTSTSYSVVLAVPGHDRIFLHNPGANNSFTSSDISEEVLNDTVLFHFGYPPLMKKMYDNDGEELVSLFKKIHEMGILTSLDLASVDPSSDAGKADWVKILTRVLPYVDFFLPSFDEINWMLNGKDSVSNKVNLLEEALPLAEKLVSMGCKVALVKCGESGMVFSTADKENWSGKNKRFTLKTDEWCSKNGIQPSFIPDCICSATGAGDTSIAAFLSAVIKGLPPEKCVQLAAAEGACCVTSYDALSAVQSLEKLEEKIENGWKTV